MSRWATKISPGKPVAPWPPSLKDILRFWSKATVDPDWEYNPSNPQIKTACWLWTGGTDPNGYPFFKYAGEKRWAIRFAYTLAHGPIPDGHQIDHLCFNRKCINPWHFEAATHSVNAGRRQHTHTHTHTQIPDEIPF